jgi:outer membrane lipoprotein-sorting protein
MKSMLGAIAILVFAGAAGAADDPAARELVKKAIDAAPKQAFQATGTLTSNRGWSREMMLYHKDVNGVDSVFINVTSPQDVSGTRFLMKDRVEGADEQFIYIPAVKRAIKVSSETRKQPFLGSDFYVADMVKPDITAYEYAFVGEEEVQGRKTKLVQATPKNPEAEIYSKTVVAVDPQEMVVPRTQFFDRDGKLFKVLTVTKLEKVDGHWTPLEQQMVDVQGSTNSILKVLDVKYNVELDDGMFDRSYLLQERTN